MFAPTVEQGPSFDVIRSLGHAYVLMTMRDDLARWLAEDGWQVEASLVSTGASFCRATSLLHAQNAAEKYHLIME